MKSLFEGQKPVAAICRGPQMLIEAEVVNGRTLTSLPSLAKDLKNAGAKWLDEALVTDQELVTSRSPKKPGRFQYQNRRGIQRSKTRWTNHLIKEPESERIRAFLFLKFATYKVLNEFSLRTARRT